MTVRAKIKRNFTIDDLIPGGATFYQSSVANRKYTAFWGEQCVVLDLDHCSLVNKKSPMDEGETLFTLADANTALASAGFSVQHLYYATFPYPGEPLVLLKGKGKQALVDWKARKTVWSQPLSESYAASDWHAASRNLAFVRDHNLFVFADMPLERPVSEDLIYFGPGEHKAGFINMHSGQTVFIDEGAVVYGQIDARGADHIRIMGRGILCGSGAVHDFQRRRSMIYCRGCRDVRVEGVLFRGSPSWTLCFSDCDSVLLDNIKEICWMRNSDGIDLCNTSNVVIRNSFLRNYDDNISLKNYEVQSGRSTSNILMTDCTLWADCAHNIVVGPENWPTLPMQNVSFENIDVLEARETAYPWRGAIGVMGSDEGTFRNVLFRNVRIDNVRGGQPFAVEFCRYRSMGRQVGNVRLENISIEGDTLGMPRSTVKGLDGEHRIEGFQLRNLRINGKKVKPREMERYVETNEFVSPLSDSLF